MPGNGGFNGWLVVGLGNPEQRYARTRHNAGFEVVESLAERWGVSGWSRRFHGLFAVAGPRDVPGGVLLLKPLTYMNLSGRAVQAAMTFHRVRPERVLVVHDEMDLDCGTVLVKVGGGTAGHRGLESIVDAVGAGFVRLRIGIGRPPARGAVDHVLSTFRPDEAEAFERAVALAADVATAVLARGPAAAMNEFHRRRNRAGPASGPLDGAPS